MELRRALMLFAIVLIMAAVVSSVARSPQRGGDETTSGAPSPPAEAVPATTTPASTTVTFPANGKPATREIEADQAATVLVEVAAAGEVTIPGLGLTEPAEPLTPALFDVLVDRPGKFEILVAPASGTPASERAGVLRVVDPS